MRSVGYLFGNSNEEIAKKSFDHDYVCYAVNDYMIGVEASLGCLPENALLSYLLKGYGDLLITVNANEIYDQRSNDGMPEYADEFVVESIRDIRQRDTIDYLCNLIPEDEWFTYDQVMEFGKYMASIEAYDAFIYFCNKIITDDHGRLFIDIPSQ